MHKDFVYHGRRRFGAPPPNPGAAHQPGAGENPAVATATVIASGRTTAWGGLHATILIYV